MLRQPMLLSIDVNGTNRLNQPCRIGVGEPRRLLQSPSTCSTHGMGRTQSRHKTTCHGWANTVCCQQSSPPSAFSIHLIMRSHAMKVRGIRAASISHDESYCGRYFASVPILTTPNPRARFGIEVKRPKKTQRIPAATKTVLNAPRLRLPRTDSACT